MRMWNYKKAYNYIRVNQIYKPLPVLFPGLCSIAITNRFGKFHKYFGGNTSSMNFVHVIFGFRPVLVYLRKEMNQPCIVRIVVRRT